MKKLMIGVAAMAAPLAMTAGCTTTDPYTGERKVNNASRGAAIGAVVGTVGGIVGSDKTSDAVLAGAAGAAIGGGIGVYMDRQEQELRDELASTGVRVQRSGDNIRLIMPGNITFPTGQSSVKPEFYTTLNSVARVLDKYNKTNVLVEGHTDDVGSDQSNLNLSIARAEAVGNYLASQGVAVPRINALGYGETQPIAANTTDSGRAQNRRVEIQLTPIG